MDNGTPLPNFHLGTEEAFRQDMNDYLDKLLLNESNDSQYSESGGPGGPFPETPWGGFNNVHDAFDTMDRIRNSLPYNKIYGHDGYSGLPDTPENQLYRDQFEECEQPRFETLRLHLKRLYGNGIVTSLTYTELNTAITGLFSLPKQLDLPTGAQPFVQEFPFPTHIL